jgi:hypothetical protein
VEHALGGDGPSRWRLVVRHPEHGAGYGENGRDPGCLSCYVPLYGWPGVPAAHGNLRSRATRETRIFVRKSKRPCKWRACPGCMTDPQACPGSTRPGGEESGPGALRFPAVRGATTPGSPYLLRPANLLCHRGDGRRAAPAAYPTSPPPPSGYLVCTPGRATACGRTPAGTSGGRRQVSVTRPDQDDLRARATAGTAATIRANSALGSLTLWNPSRAA